MDPPTQLAISSVRAHVPDGVALKRPRRPAPAEKRQFAKKPHKKHGNADFSSLSTREVDEMIARLLNLRDQTRNRKPKGAKGRPLESRISRDGPKEKELSVTKLQKIQKRREIRLERNKARQAKKAAEQGDQAEPAREEPSTDIAPTAAPAPARAPALASDPGSVPAEVEVQELDEINFDDL